MTAQVFERNTTKRSRRGFYLIKVRRQIWAQFDHEVPPDLHLCKKQGLRPYMDGCERLHEEFHALAAAQNVWKQRRYSTSDGWRMGLTSWTAIQTGSVGQPGLRAKLSMRLFQAMKAIFLMDGDELRKPSSSRCSKEFIKGPPLCSNCLGTGVGGTYVSATEKQIMSANFQN